VDGTDVNIGIGVIYYGIYIYKLLSLYIVSCVGLCKAIH
jgi:hypothetical protein